MRRKHVANASDGRAFAHSCMIYTFHNSVGDDALGGLARLQHLTLVERTIIEEIPLTLFSLRRLMKQIETEYGLIRNKR